jgi:hypothetical protein
MAPGRIGAIVSGANADIPRRIGIRMSVPRTHQKTP